ncbi:hypothetical protein CAter282_0078 [Collimonas arenae]|uniref:Uncharacterized protein n=2 Tax=Collimonas arenae TaxID=279058 RepID=A0A127QE58_9BURK|nr:hypothetical protein CAter282_0078 [Collimonas arenae]
MTAMFADSADEIARHDGDETINRQQCHQQHAADFLPSELLHLN